MSSQEIHSFEIVDEQAFIGLIEIVSYTNIERVRIIEMVEAGLLEPIGNAIEQWQFALRDVRRIRAAQRLVNDLGVNLASAALILDLIEERDALRARVALLQRMMNDL